MWDVTPHVYKWEESQAGCGMLHPMYSGRSHRQDVGCYTPCIVGGVTGRMWDVTPHVYKWEDIVYLACVEDELSSSCETFCHYHQTLQGGAEGGGEIGKLVLLIAKFSRYTVYHIHPE